MFDPSVPVEVILPGDDDRETTRGRRFAARVLTARAAPAVRAAITAVIEDDMPDEARNAAAARQVAELLTGWTWPGGPAFDPASAADVLLDHLTEEQLWKLLGLVRAGGVELAPSAEKKSAGLSAESAPAA